MRWFWKKREEPSPELEAIQQVLEQNNLLVEQYRELAEQVTRLSRLQYKTSKDLQGKVNEIYDSIQKQEQESSNKELRIIRAETKLEELAYFLIDWLDDLDLLYSNFTTNDQEEWKSIIKKWINQILVQLEGLGINELQVIGSTFDPTLAESLGTISKKEAEMKYKEIVSQDIPYQVVEVLKRGFIWKNGTLLRKAHVITLEMGNEYE
ncbi:nucleotide exchange factor GrpE [Bacillus sp. IITD106]|nr:nucleotide exchange factor GrpE [Bacillus sp. IITD106]